MRLGGFLRTSLVRISTALAFGRLREFLTHPLTTASGSALIAAYFGALDYWNDEDWIKNYTGLHKTLFYSLVGCVGVVQLMIRVGDRVRERTKVLTVDAMKEFVKAVSLIVGAKTHRCREFCVKPKKTGLCEHSNNPRQQISVIFTQIAQYLERIADIQHEQFDATVIRRNSSTNKWETMSYLRPNFSRPKADELMSIRSTAKIANETGNEQFHESKTHASKGRQYVTGKRDLQFGGDGSIYCRPIRVEIGDSVDEFVITFVTYGTTFCDRYDTLSIQAWILILREFSERIQLELIQYAMIEYAKRHRSPTARKRA